jgi:hypothetical protein
MLLKPVLISLVSLLSACATVSSGVSKKEAIKIATAAIDDREHWKHGGDFTATCYRIDGRRAGCKVRAMEVVDPSVPRRIGTKGAVPEDARRYAPGHFTTVTIDNSGKIIYYLPGVL